MEKRNLPRLAHNVISLIGAVIALSAGLVLAFFLIISLIAHKINPYLGILLYMVLPAILVAGLLLIPAGMYVRWRGLQKKGAIAYHKWPDIDLNKKGHRNAALIFMLGTTAFIVISAVGIYQAYHYTDSVAFCGLTCHTVMHPEYATYQDSPHARVECVACHIGPGAGWYARSKLSGLYQVYATIAGKYPKPIPTPIGNLRPAQETCEQCHWPSQFFGGQQRQFNYYLYDRTNTHWQINMLIKTGGGNPKTSQTSGVHWHMNIARKVEYIARDKKRQDIPWVRITDRETGKAAVYQDISRPLSQDELALAKPRIMDCMDCHNRPSHNLHSPDYAINFAILTGLIDPALPEIKQVAVNAMNKEYRSSALARDNIAGEITSFYRIRHPEVYSQKEKMINSAIQAIQTAFMKNIFPEMKAKWSDYLDNIGHFIFRGCMRCHDGNHRDSKGSVITNDCRTCHIILSQGIRERPEILNLQVGLDFRHPLDIGDAWKGGACYECHKGIQP